MEKREIATHGIFRSLFFVYLLSCGINLTETEMENGNGSCCCCTQGQYGQCQGPTKDDLRQLLLVAFFRRFLGLLCCAFSVRFSPANHARLAGCFDATRSPRGSVAKAASKLANNCSSK